MTERREYSSTDRLVQGVPGGVRQPVHPVQVSMARADRLQAERHADWLRQLQGLHAPLRLRAELRAASRVGRLPCLRSSNLMTATLTGADDEMDFSDIFGFQEGLEQSGQPHAMVEKQLGLL